MTEPWWSKDGQKEIKRRNAWFYLLMFLTFIVLLGLAIIGVQSVLAMFNS